MNALKLYVTDSMIKCAVFIFRLDFSFYLSLLYFGEIIDTLGRL